MANFNQRMIPPYILGETIGQGGYSKVKLGVHSESGQQVALKLLSKQQGSDSLKQVKREIEAMTKINHENVLKCLDVNWDAAYPIATGGYENMIMVVLELATGGELFDFLSYTGCFEESVARSYFVQLITGLDACHSNQVCHRDLKPENLLLSDDFTLKIADFGFAAIQDGTRALRTECGTRAYMAPEIFRGKVYDGQAADIWSCGVILFICLAGFPPFQNPMPNDWWFHKLLTNNHSLFWDAHCRTAYFSPLAKDLINQMLQPDPEKRISLAGIKSHPWFQAAAIPAQALSNELSRRKAQVDISKRQAKLAEQAKVGGTGVYNVDRDLADEVFANMPEIPVFESSKARPVNYNIIRTAFTPQEALTCIEALFQNPASGSKASLDVPTLTVTVVAPSSFGPVEFSATLFKEFAEVEQGQRSIYLAEVKKIKGDSFGFRRLYTKLEAALTGIDAPVDKSLEHSLTAEEIEEFKEELDNM